MDWNKSPDGKSRWRSCDRCRTVIVQTLEDGIWFGIGSHTDAQCIAILGQVVEDQGLEIESLRSHVAGFYELQNRVAVLERSIPEEK